MRYQEVRDIQDPITEIHLLMEASEAERWFRPGQDLNLEEENVPDSFMIGLKHKNETHPCFSSCIRY